ncbi:Zinc finger C2H2-type [Cinara cedri]|uniref:Zinc finger C2H2-type n=1 Tax=Cinara cedri TaxID=506608 RepID=A0A5E4MYX5_9HEMI|nr:Zinc finger C2H2-type [Cinara cedri]
MNDLNIKPQIDRQSQTAVPVKIVGTDQGVTVVPALAPFACSVCGVEFTTKTGVGVHLHKAHGIVANSQIVVERKKFRWTDEEKRLVAHIEAEGQLSGIPPKGINAYLIENHPVRSVESLKARRTCAEHRQLVGRALHALKRGQMSPVLELTEDTPEVVVEESTSSFDVANDENGSFASVRASTDRVSTAKEVADCAVALLATVT